MCLAVALKDGRKLPKFEFLPDALRKLVVMLPVGILGPGIEAPVSQRDPFLVSDKDRAGIARPDTVCGPDVKVHALAIDVAALQDLACYLLFARRRHNQIYVLMAGQVANDIGKGPGDGVEFSRPV